MAKIVTKENKILKEIAKDVPPELFGTKKLAQIISDMSTALAREDDGVALAAPQIGLSLRLFVVSGKVLSYGSQDEPTTKKEPDLVFINPEITSLSKTKRDFDEGCLSVRWLYGQVKRATKATIIAYDFNGKKFTRSASGLMAQIFQHEVDHLNGVLFTEKARNLQEYEPEGK